MSDVLRSRSTAQDCQSKMAVSLGQPARGPLALVAKFGCQDGAVRLEDSGGGACCEPPRFPKGWRRHTRAVPMTFPGSHGGKSAGRARTTHTCCEHPIFLARERVGLQQALPCAWRQLHPDLLFGLLRVCRAHCAHAGRPAHRVSARLGQDSGRGHGGGSRRRNHCGGSGRRVRLRRRHHLLLRRQRRPRLCFCLRPSSNRGTHLVPSRPAARAARWYEPG